MKAGLAQQPCGCTSHTHAAAHARSAHGRQGRAPASAESSLRPGAAGRRAVSPPGSDRSAQPGSGKGDPGSRLSVPSGRRQARS